MKPLALAKNLAAIEAFAPKVETHGPYGCFDQINGNHPLKYAVPNGYVEYQARILRKSKVVFFNFALAKEMGLIAKDHPHSITKELEKKLVETFSLRIINEYDQLTGAKFPQKDIKTNRYMATRYLQLQHSNKLGTTSGDGRGMWNGHFYSADGADWDISSCGTGVTRLSPGFVESGIPIKTGDKKVSYGSGLADVDEGLTAAILSESFHKRGIFTERTLAIIEGPEGGSVNVRAAKNLLRPSHLFLHLKQGNQLTLKSALDFYISKQIYNRDWPAGTREQEKYDVFLRRIASRYGEFAARLEDEYIFCWLDWDGDNMLVDGGIIDYGSIRQFGLCHHQYRYDDVDRYSTNLKEQKKKARYLVQTFVQLVDFVRTGVKKDLKAYAEDPALKIFDRSYKRTRMDLLLKRVGLDAKKRKWIMKFRPALAVKFFQIYNKFEYEGSTRGMRNTADGINNPALFCMRSLLKELPKRYLLTEQELSSEEFLQIMQTQFLTKKQIKEANKYSRAVATFQKTYLSLIQTAYGEKSLKQALLETTMRAGEHNRTDYATGDGIIHVVDALLKKRKTLGASEFQKLVDSFILQQQGLPLKIRLKQESRKILQKLLLIVQDNKNSL